MQEFNVVLSEQIERDFQVYKPTLEFFRPRNFWHNLRDEVDM